MGAQLGRVQVEGGANVGVAVQADAGARAARVDQWGWGWWRQWGWGCKLDNTFAQHQTHAVR
jgi:hypothetical protein